MKTANGLRNGSGSRRVTSNNAFNKIYLEIPVMTDFGPPYCKINTLWKRDMSVKGNPVVPGAYSQPEFEYLANVLWRWTEKVDGTNIRLYWNGGKLTIGGRTNNAQVPAHLTDALKDAGYLDEQKYLTAFGDAPVTIFGEGYGPRIQKGGGLYRDTPGFIVFDVKVGDWWLKPDDIRDVASKFGMDVVPYYGDYSISHAWTHLAHDGIASYWPNVAAEGIVGTPLVPLLDRSGHRLIVKMKVKDWTDYQRIKWSYA